MLHALKTEIQEAATTLPLTPTQYRDLLYSLSESQALVQAHLFNEHITLIIDSSIQSITEGRFMQQIFDYLAAPFTQ